MSKEDIIIAIEAEISRLQKEVSKWETILSQMQEMEYDVSPETKRRTKPVTKARRGRPPASAAKKKKSGPGRPPLKTSKKKTTPRRRRYDVPVSDMIAGVLNTMRQPANITDLTEKVHVMYPTLGGAKYKAIVSSMVSRDKRFKRIGKDHVELRNRV